LWIPQSPSRSGAMPVDTALPPMQIARGEHLRPDQMVVTAMVSPQAASGMTPAGAEVLPSRGSPRVSAATMAAATARSAATVRPRP
jgi:hypothetical protein